MKKLDETTKEHHFCSSKDIYFPCEKDARRRLFRLQGGEPDGEREVRILVDARGLTED